MEILQFTIDFMESHRKEWGVKDYIMLLNRRFSCLLGTGRYQLIT